MNNNKQIRLLLARVQSLEDTNEALKAERDRLRETVEPLVVYIRKWKNDDIPCDLTAACEELINHKEGS